MLESQNVVVIGAGHSGGRAAATLRRLGFQGRISLLGEENDPPYERPPLSKEVLAKGAHPLTGCLYPREFYQEHDIDFRGGCKVLGLDAARRRIELADGTRMEANHLVLACGARARKMQLPGARLNGVLTLRSAVDAGRLAPLLKAHKRVVLVGGGFVGLEVAASAAKRGCQVTVLEAQSQLLERLLPRTASTSLEKLHAGHGVDIGFNCVVEAFEDSGGRVAAVKLADGKRVPADVVVVGVGATPNSELAVAAGLPCEDGVLTDACCHTAAPGIYAIGDLSCHVSRWAGKRLRLESWDNAERQARTAAETILGAPGPPVNVPWFWTDQHDLNVQVLGLPGRYDVEVTRGQPGESGSCVFRLHKERVVLAVLFNAGRERRPVTEIMTSKANVDAAVLADPQCSLRDLAHSPDAERGFGS